jgi:DNA gyrase subunit B
MVTTILTRIRLRNPSWGPSLNPEKRMLVRVQLDDVLKADEMFRMLMGEKVEPRRVFIEKCGLEVKDIDVHES